MWAVENVGIGFSCHEQIKNDENFMKHFIKIEKVLNLWRLINLAVQGKIPIFNLNSSLLLLFKKQYY